ncbi:MAG: hypothetical protein LBI70_01880 [Rickettsiales bacterium]|jgi:glutamine synthetase|nr:hypothetical protein [Rickettsiales bacterium]
MKTIDSFAGWVEPNYLQTPCIFFIKNNSRVLLERVADRLVDRGYFPKIGLEVEFYTGETVDMEDFVSTLDNFTGAENINYAGVAKEVGLNQLEIKLNPYESLDKLLHDFQRLKNFLLGSDYGILLAAVPFYYQPRSALQINVSLNDADGKNLFAKDAAGGESEVLLNSIAGILETTNSFLPLYAGSEDVLLAHDLEFNRIMFARKKSQVPTHNSWGIDNRSCSIRIPTSKNFYSESDYKTDSLLNRRLEFRVAASDCDLTCALFALLQGIFYGIQNNLEPPRATSNNVLEHHEEYRGIFTENKLQHILQPDIFNL